jgi:Asp-tRNA(Asn)/Glu-tRNA(Gln) amidotransferase A subunit family amidase
MPRYLRKFFLILLGFLGKTREKKIIQRLEGDISLSEYLEEIRKLEGLKRKFVKTYQDNGYDSIISPVTPFPALRKGETQDLFVFLHFTIVYNFLDFSAGVIPIRKCGKIKSDYQDEYNDRITLLINESLKGSENLPIGIQIATLPQLDEACLGIMQIIDKILRENKVIELMN